MAAWSLGTGDGRRYVCILDMFDGHVCNISVRGGDWGKARDVALCIIAEHRLAQAAEGMVFELGRVKGADR